MGASHHQFIGKRALGIAGKARGRRPKLHPQKAMGKVNRANLLEFKDFNRAAGKRLAQQVAHAVPDHAVAAGERVGELYARDIQSIALGAEKLHLLVAHAADRQRMGHANVHALGVQIASEC